MRCGRRSASGSASPSAVRAASLVAVRRDIFQGLYARDGLRRGRPALSFDALAWPRPSTALATTFYNSAHRWSDLKRYGRLRRAVRAEGPPRHRRLSAGHIPHSALCRYVALRCTMFIRLAMTVSAAAIVVWDYLLTLDGEIEWLRERKWSFGKVLFLLVCSTPRNVWTSF
jgi:hypothetical protein